MIRPIERRKQLSNRKKPESDSIIILLSRHGIQKKAGAMHISIAPCLSSVKNPD
jgi:hypothetical protein